MVHTAVDMVPAIDPAERAHGTALLKAAANVQRHLDGDRMLLLVAADGRHFCLTAYGTPDKTRGSTSHVGDLPAGEARALLRDLAQLLAVPDVFAEPRQVVSAPELGPGFMKLAPAVEPERKAELDAIDERMERALAEHDPVNHPRHYTSLPARCSACAAPIECIDVTRHMGFNLGNAVKYLWREGLKAGVEDLKKAVWYITDEIRQRERSP